MGTAKAVIKRGFIIFTALFRPPSRYRCHRTGLAKPSSPAQRRMDQFRFGKWALRWPDRSTAIQIPGRRSLGLLANLLRDQQLQALDRMVKMDLRVVFANPEDLRDLREGQIAIDSQGENLALAARQLEHRGSRHPLALRSLQAVEGGRDNRARAVQRLDRGALPTPLLSRVVLAEVDHDPQKPGAEWNVAAAAKPLQRAPCRLECLEECALRKIAGIVGAHGVSTDDLEHQILMSPDQLAECSFVSGHERTAQLGVLWLVRGDTVNQPQPVCRRQSVFSHGNNGPHGSS